jgi:hypothetical protein
VYIDDVLFAALTAPPSLGDFNRDSVVDGADLAIWSAAFGVDARGDANADGYSDGADFLIWQQQLSSLSALSDAVPEPFGVPMIEMAFVVIWQFVFVAQRARVIV